MINTLLCCHIILLLICACFADDQSGNFCNSNTIISNSSKVSANIGKVLAQLTAPGVAQKGFTTASSGTLESDKVYGLVQCRGDVSVKDCSDCIQNAAVQIRTSCPNQADSRIWYDRCFLRYSNTDFIGQVDTSVGILFWNVQNVTDPQTFKKQLGALADKIESKAVKTASNKGLGKGKTDISPFVTLYALVQCTRDLSPIGCAECLAVAISNFEGVCNDKKGCRVLYSSCYVRYELYPFYFPLDSSTTSAATATASLKVYH